MQRLFREAGLGGGLKRDRGTPAPADRGMILLTSKAGRSTLAKRDDWRVAMFPMNNEQRQFDGYHTAPPSGLGK